MREVKETGALDSSRADLRIVDRHDVTPDG